MPKYLVVLEATVEVEAEEIGYAEEVALEDFDKDSLSASYIEETF